MAFKFYCPKCGHSEYISGSNPRVCSNCGWDGQSPILVELKPTDLRTPADVAAEALQTDDPREKIIHDTLAQIQADLQAVQITHTEVEDDEDYTYEAPPSFFKELTPDKFFHILAEVYHLNMIECDEWSFIDAARQDAAAIMMHNAQWASQKAEIERLQAENVELTAKNQALKNTLQLIQDSCSDLYDQMTNGRQRQDIPYALEVAIIGDHAKVGLNSG